jgi:hypothetical protein
MAADCALSNTNTQAALGPQSDARVVFDNLASWSPQARILSKRFSGGIALVQLSDHFCQF